MFVKSALYSTKRRRSIAASSTGVAWMLTANSGDLGRA
jgi:hypothetical protein